MNTALMLEIADAIEETKQFDLDSFVGGVGVNYEDPFTPGCGTTMCVCGWANWLTRRKGAKSLRVEQFEDEEHAAKKLGLDHGQAHRLFYAGAGSVWGGYAKRYRWDWYEGNDIIAGEMGIGVSEWRQIKPHQAARVLRDIANGKVEL